MPDTLGTCELELPAVRTVRTFEAVVEGIVSAIERARLRTGDRLPTEAEMCRQMGISTPTLRQALRLLEQSGLLSVRRGSAGGVFVASDLIPVEEIAGAVALEADAVLDALRGRRLLESLATDYALEQATPADLDEIERSVELLRRNVGDRPKVMRADAMFHRAVVRACHNRTVEDAMRATWKTMAAVRDMYQGGPEMDRRTLGIHERQCRAMAAGDREQVRAVLDEHFRLLEDAYVAAVGLEWEEVFARAPCAGLVSCA